jgi:exopolyphosphatase / guanosine-5'-triphosphate,3'-diphosphate pyrophosphatase
METLAAIDVGTNSVHLVVARITPSGFEVLADEKAMVRLGHGGGDMKLLTPDAIDRGVAALARFKQIADIDGASVRAVATSAMREADNRDEFLRRARLEAGVEVEVISGVEEARLIHLGVLQALPVLDDRLLLCDIGGGSTELVLGRGGEVLASRSLKLGSVRLTDRFFPGERLHPAAVASCRAYVRSMVLPFHKELDAFGFDVAAGSSGTIQAVAAMVQATTGQPPPRSWNRFTFTADDLAGIVAALVAAPSVRERSKVPGLEARRADIILAGALVLEGVVGTLGIDEIVVSGYALREGVLLDTVQRTHGGSLHHLRDISRRSVLQLAELMDDEPDHREQVARLALLLFDATSPQHGLDAVWREFLEAAALLANIGLYISHSQHHLHSYYVIRNTERLVGFTDAEIEVIAQVARYHRKSEPKASHPAFQHLGADEQHVVRALAGILRVAIGLDRSHEGRVRGVVVQAEGGTLTIGVQPAGDADIGLELYAANERKDLLAKVLGLEVRIVPAP